MFSEAGDSPGVTVFHGGALRGNSGFSHGGTKSLRTGFAFDYMYNNEIVATTIMSSIQNYFSQKSTERPRKGQTGEFTDWLSFHELELRGDLLQFVETRVIGIIGDEEYENTEIPAAPGVYSVECKGVAFGGDKRVAAMRAYPKGVNVMRGKKIGSIPVDLGGVSVVDIKTVKPSMDEDEERYEEWLEDLLYDFDDYSAVKIHQWKPTMTKIPNAESGFGDGEYDVYELLNDGAVVGMEVEFIAEDEEYPM